MAGPLEWQQVSTQGVNPADSFRNYYQGLAQAAQITDGLRGKQLQADDSIMRGHDSVIKNSLDIDKNNFSKQRHADNMDLEREKMESAELRAAMKAAGEGSGSTDFDRGALGLEIRNHFDNGGNEDNALENPVIAEAVRTDKGYKFFVDESNRYSTGYNKFMEAEAQKRTVAMNDELAKLEQDFKDSNGAISEDAYQGMVAGVKQKYELAGLGAMENGRTMYAQRRADQTRRLGGTSSDTTGSNRQNLENDVGTTQENVDINRTRLANTNNPEEIEQLEAAVQQGEQELLDLENSKIFRNKNGDEYILDYIQSDKGDLTLSNGLNISSRQATLINDAAMEHDVPFGLVAALLKPAVEDMTEEGVTDEELETNLDAHADIIAAGLRESLDNQGDGATLERAYTDVVTQGKDLSKVFNLSNDRNTPINELMKDQGFSPNVINFFEQDHKNAVPFKNEKGKWLTINQWEKSIPAALGFSPADPAADVDVDVLKPRDTPASEMTDKVQEMKLAGNNTVENIQDVAKEVGKNKANNLDELILRDSGIPDMDAANMLVSELVGPFVMRPAGSGKSLSQLTKDEFESLTGGVKFNDDEQAYGFYTKLLADPAFRDMGEEDLAVALSFAVRGNYFNSFDQISTERNIASLKQMWDGQNEDYKAVKANIKGLKDNWGKMTEAFDKAAVIRDKVEASNIGMKVNPNFNKNSPLAQEQTRLNQIELQKALNIEQTAIEHYYPAVRANAEQLATVQAARAGTFENRAKIEAETKADAMEEKNFVKQFSMTYNPAGHITTNSTSAGRARQMLSPEEQFNFDAKKYTAEQNARIESGRVEAKRIFDFAKKHNIPTKMLHGIDTVDKFNNLLERYGIEERL